MSKKVAFITGITGQDGSYLAEFLFKKGYEVHGLYRHSSSFNTSRIEHLYMEDLLLDKHNNVKLHYGDLTDSSSLVSIIQKVKPTEIYHLAAQSHVKVSFEVPIYTANANCLGTLQLLEALRIAGIEKDVRFYNAVTSELYGLVQEIPQSETTPFYPRSPYGVAKLYAFWIAKNYRESYDMFVTNGILFNHESERRGENFVTRKITLAVGKIHYGLQKKLHLGNLDAQRDWGYAPDYVELMWKMLQHSKADDFVIATGKTHSVRKFCELAFKEVGIELKWEGKAEQEKGIDVKTGNVLIEVDPRYYRPAEVDLLLGNPEKAEKTLDWNANKTSIEEIVKKMVKHDLELARIEKEK